MDRVHVLPGRRIVIHAVVCGIEVPFARLVQCFEHVLDVVSLVVVPTAGYQRRRRVEEDGIVARVNRLDPVVFSGPSEVIDQINVIEVVPVWIQIVAAENKPWIRQGQKINCDLVFKIIVKMNINIMLMAKSINSCVN